MTLDDAIRQLTRMKEEGVPGDTKMCGRSYIAFQPFTFELNDFDDTDYKDKGITVCIKDIVFT